MKLKSSFAVGTKLETSQSNRAASSQRPSHVNSGRGCVGSLGDGEINTDPPPINLHSGTTLSRLFSVFLVLVVNESKSTTPSGCAIVDDVGAGQRTITPKDFLEILFPGIVGEIEDSEASAFGRRISISFVALPVGHGRPGSAATTGRPPRIPTSAIATPFGAGSRARMAAFAVVARSGARTTPTPIAAATAALAFAFALALAAAPIPAIATHVPTFAAGSRTPTLAATDALAPTLAARLALLARGGSLSHAFTGSVGVGVGTGCRTCLATGHLALSPGYAGYRYPNVDDF